MTLITRTTSVVRADELAVGDIIPGVDTLDKKTPAHHKVTGVSDVKIHPVLGRAVEVFTEDTVECDVNHFVLRAGDRLHVER